MRRRDTNLQKLRTVGKDPGTPAGAGGVGGTNEAEESGEAKGVALRIPSRGNAGRGDDDDG